MDPFSEIAPGSDCRGLFSPSGVRPTEVVIDSTPMSWARKLAAPIILKDGRMIATLGEARAVMQSLPERRQHNELWLYVGARLHESAFAKGSLSIARAQLTRALKAEGLT
jgi:hypothetical protein